MVMIDFYRYEGLFLRDLTLELVVEGISKVTSQHGSGTSRGNAEVSSRQNAYKACLLVLITYYPLVTS
jgi:hypothetical protein